MPILDSEVMVGTVARAASGTTLNTAYPTATRGGLTRAIRPDDVLVLSVQQTGATLVPTQTGYTADARLSGTGNTLSPSSGGFHKKAAGGETGNLGVATNNVTQQAQLYAVPEVDLLSILDAAATSGGITTKDQTATQATCQHTSLTPAGPNRLMVALTNPNTNGQTATIDSSYTEDGDGDGSTRAGQNAHLVTATGGGAPAAQTPTVTFSGTGKQVGILLCLKPRPPIRMMMCA